MSRGRWFRGELAGSELEELVRLQCPDAPKDAVVGFWVYVPAEFEPDADLFIDEDTVLQFEIRWEEPDPPSKSNGVANLGGRKDY
jgi:hypothetical protein